MTKLVVTGDSITTNIYATTTYASLIASATGLTTVNTAVSGYSSSSVLSNINSMIISQTPDICILMIGTNDIANASASNLDNANMVSTYIANMQSIITQVKTAGSKLILLSPPITRNINEYKRGEELVEALKWLCIANDVEFIDVYSKFAAIARSKTLAEINSYYLLDPDKYHLNNSGHALIANYILQNNILQSIEAPPPVTSTNIVYNTACNSLFGNMGSSTIRCVIPTSSFSNLPTLDVTKFKLTLQSAVDEPITIGNAYLGISTSGCDASSLVPIKVGGASSFTLPINAQVETDWLDLAWNKTSNLILTVYCSGGSSSDRLVAYYNNPNAITYLKAGNDAGSLSPSGFIAYSGYLSLISKIETDGYV